MLHYADCVVLLLLCGFYFTSAMFTVLSLLSQSNSSFWEKVLKSVKVQDWLSGRELPGWVSGITSKTYLKNDLGRYKALKNQGKQYHACSCQETSPENRIQHKIQLESTLQY